MEKLDNDNLIEKADSFEDNSKSILQFKKYRMVKKSILLGFMLSLVPTIIVLIAANIFETLEPHPITTLSIYISFLTYLTLFMGRKFFALMNREGVTNSANDHKVYAYLMPIMATVVATIFHLIFAASDSPIIYPAILLGRKLIYGIGLAAQDSLIAFHLFSFFLSLVLAGASGYLATLLLKKEN